MLNVANMLCFCFKLGDSSLLVFFGLRQSSAKLLSLQSKHLILGLDL